MTLMDLAEVQRAKKALMAEYGDCTWFRGVGIAPSPVGFSLRLNVDPAAGLSKRDLPTRYRGIPVEVVFIGEYRHRPKAKAL